MSTITFSAPVGILSLIGRGVLLAGSVVSLVGSGCSSASVANETLAGEKGGQGGRGGSGNTGTGGCGVLCGGFGGSAGGAVIPGNPKNCGNGVKDSGEGCDDGVAPDKKTGPNAIDTGCNALCQIEANWTCPTAGQPCEYLGVCGNKVLTSNKECDDGNTASGDGCSSTCKLEPGWSCRVAGKPCSPTCGDGIVELGKECDDGNDVSGDGCSSTCQIEPGWSCTGAPSACAKGKCGNGIVETGEACDCGTDSAKLPTGCTGPNGLFHGDGSGCSKTCTVEPICRGTNGTGATHACEATCGNGNLETGEECDDGNLIDGDGCSKACKIEDGFKCTTQNNQDTQPCTQSLYSGDCLELPVKYRDFQSEKETNGHPDFFYYGATLQSASVVSISGVAGQPGAVSYNKRYCVPNSAGPARQNDSTQRCWGMAQANLDSNGRPAFDKTRNGGGANATLCDCQFTDWSHDTNGGHVPGYTQAANGPTNGLTYTGGANGHPMYKGLAPIVTSADTFAQWWVDSKYTNNTHIVSTLELGPVAGQTNLFRYSSAPHSIYGNFFPLDPPANNFPIYSLTGSTTGPGTVRISTTGNNEPLLCNVWPYWYSSTGFGAGANCKADQYVFPPSFAPGVDPATWFGMHPNGDWIPQAQGWFHDSWFSVEARYLFAFDKDFQLQFFGDDDTFVFINGVLVIDLGGVHQRLPASVKVDAATGNATIQEGGNVYLPCTNPTGQTVCPVIPAGYAVGDLVPCDGSADAKDPVTKVPFNSTCPSGSSTCDCRQRKVPLGLKTGNTYEIAVFERDGHPTESNFQLTLSGFSTTESTCEPRCGDGVVSGGEECDCGDGTVPVRASCSGQQNDDTVYGGCTTQCKWGPYCGDGTTQSPQEQCDQGKLNGSNNGPDGCMFGCLRPHYCGDASVDTNLGEECDLGALNGVLLDINGQPTTTALGGTVECTTDCKIPIR